MGKFWAMRLLGLLLRLGAIVASLVILLVSLSFAQAGLLPVALLYFCASVISPVALWALGQFLELMIDLERNTRHSVILQKQILAKPARGLDTSRLPKAPAWDTDYDPPPF